MGVVNLEYVISYSSQDSNYKAENLLSNPGKPWLCSSSDKSGCLEAEFQLNKTSSIDFIDIGNNGSSSVEIQVCKASFQNKYVSLLPAVTLLSRTDIKDGADLKSVYMFDKSNMNKSTSDDQWDRIKVICCQPYKKQCQFGLAFLSLRSKDSRFQLNIEEQPSLNRKNERLFPKYFLHSETDGDSPKISRGKQLLNASFSRKYPVPQTNSKRTSPDTFHEDVNIFLITCSSEDFENKMASDYIKEFENQRQEKLTALEKLDFSKYFEIFRSEQNPTTSPLLNRISNGSLSSSNSPLTTSPVTITATNGHKAMSFLKKTYSREKKPVPCESATKPDVLDFDVSFHDDNERQLSDGQNAILKGNQTRKRLKVSDDSHPKPATNFSPGDFIQFDGVQPSTSRGFTFVDCPICREPFHPSEIEKHAATCGDLSVLTKSPPHTFNGHKYPEIIDLEPSIEERCVDCPICGNMYPEMQMSDHIDKCLDN